MDAWDIIVVLNKRGKPLMPCSPAKARHLLKEKKAAVVRRTPFTIQLTIATGESKQPVSLGVDAGYKHVGLSASTEKAELYASEVELRQDITDLLSARRALRQSRRNRKTRYRAPRFDNRIDSAGDLSYLVLSLYDDLFVTFSIGNIDEIGRAHV